MITTDVTTMARNYMSRNINNEVLIEALKYLYEYEQRKSFNCTNLIVQLNVSKFHKSVLLAMLQIKFGCTISYSNLAAMCNSNAVRHVATLVGKNPLPIIVPCHRVVRKDGNIGNYLFGTSAKQILLEYEKQYN
jgi:O-6-methylguanine DNA methyltransferase